MLGLFVAAVLPMTFFVALQEQFNRNSSLKVKLIGLNCSRVLSSSAFERSLKIVGTRFSGFNMLYFNKLANPVKVFGQIKCVAI